MLYMVIERFKNREALPVYRRFREKGRMMPKGLNYVESWVETNFDRCFQLMECEDALLLEEWLTSGGISRSLSLCRCALRSKRRSLSRQNSNYALPGKCWVLRRRVISAAKLGRSCSMSAVNFNPSPAPGFAWRTTASARIWPSATRKSIRARVPKARVCGVSMKSPPMLMLRTCEISSRP